MDRAMQLFRRLSAVMILVFFTFSDLIGGGVRAAQAQSPKPWQMGMGIPFSPVKERIIGDSQADKLVGVTYRKPWKLPYYPRA